MVKLLKKPYEDFKLLKHIMFHIIENQIAIMKYIKRDMELSHSYEGYKEIYSDIFYSIEFNDKLRMRDFLDSV